MNDRKQIAWGVVLIVVVIGAVLFMVNCLRDTPPEPPPIISGMSITKVDTETLEPMVLSMSEWEELGNRDGIYKHPETGAYTMAPATKCPNPECDKWAPLPQEPADLLEGLDEAQANAKSKAWEKEQNLAPQSTRRVYGDIKSLRSLRPPR